MCTHLIWSLAGEMIKRPMNSGKNQSLVVLPSTQNTFVDEIHFANETQSKQKNVRARQQKGVFVCVCVCLPVAEVVFTCLSAQSTIALCNGSLRVCDGMMVNDVFYMFSRSPTDKDKEYKICLHTHTSIQQRSASHSRLAILTSRNSTNELMCVDLPTTPLPQSVVAIRRPNRFNRISNRALNEKSQSNQESRSRDMFSFRLWRRRMS